MQGIINHAASQTKIRNSAYRMNIDRLGNFQYSQLLNDIHFYDL